MRRLLIGALAALVGSPTPAAAAMYWMPAFHAEICQDYTAAKGAGVACTGDVVLLGPRLNYDDVMLGRISADIPPQMIAVDAAVVPPAEWPGAPNSEPDMPYLPAGAKPIGVPYYVTIGHRPIVERIAGGAVLVTF